MIKNFFNFIFFISITNTFYLRAHDLINGGCDHHCEELNESISIEKTINGTKPEKRIEDNYSCLKKSLCRG